jgi:GT2 family glycosyltransferase
VTGWWRIRYPFAEGTTASIIVDATGSAAKVRSTLDSLLEKTGHRSFEILVVPRSPELDIPSLQEDFKHSQNSIRFLPAQLTMAWANAMNAAGREAQSSALIFLRSPSIVLSSDWLGAMLEHAMRPEVGAVGGKILAGNGTIATAGLLLGVKGLMADAFAGLQGSTPHYFGLSNVVRNVSAVSARCLGTSATAFKALGGFDEENFPSELAAPDYCLRAGQAGLRTVYSPYALLQQEAGDALAAGKHPESERFRARWADAIANDPYYNINLTRTRTDYTLRQKSK